MWRAVILAGLILSSSFFPHPARGADLSSPITLAQAQALALLKSPELAAFSYEVRAREAQALQAGLLPNPELGVEIEDFGGTREFHGFSSSQTTVQIGQTIPLTGRPAKQRQVALLESDLARWDYQAKRQDVLADVAKAFVDVLAAQERLAVASDLLRLAEQVAGTTAARVQAGKVSPVEETKAKVALATVWIELERARRNLDGARKRLAATWAEPSPTFERAEGLLDALASIPASEQLAESIDKNPDIARWGKELDQRDAVLKLAEAKRVPEPTVNLGFRHISETSDQTVVMGVSIPLPVFDRNQGGIAEAQRRIFKAQEERASARFKVLTALAEAYQALTSAHTEAAALAAQVIPGAESAFEAASEGYRQGKLGYLDVLDAQRTLFEARSRYIEALAAYHKAAADVKRLTGEEPQSSGSSSKGN
jgi:cobalt-zinc-cadmium efflux system outer membrane protein